MSETLERLRNIGAQKIYEETHIPVEHVQAIIHESFDSFSKVQFLGFVAILEREYHEDLSQLRLHGLETFKEEEEAIAQKSVFVAPKRKKKYTILYILLAIGIFLAVSYYNTNTPKETTVAPVVDNTIIIDAQKNLDLVDANESNVSSIDVNSSVADINTTVKEVAEEVVVEEKVINSLKFVTKTKLWLGYIDRATNKHYNKIFTGEFELDADKDWLLVFGHGFVDIVVNGEIIPFKSKENLRFSYEDGKIEALNLREFKKLNRGNKW